MNIDIIPCLNDNYSYLIHDENSNSVTIIDPSEFEQCDKIISKKYKKLDFILNTHHHYDHVGGNEKLKKKYNSSILAFESDKNRIPGINKFLKDNQQFKIGNLNFLVIFIPGHTSGHIAFYLEKEKVVFTGDTLFSLGCGRVFEGTYEQMFQSCGHEYTYQNLEFCLKYNPNNILLKKRKNIIMQNLKNKRPTVPSTIGDEIQTNIFFKYDDQDVKKAIKLENSSNLEIFKKLRELKDDF